MSTSVHEGSNHEKAVGLENASRVGAVQLILASGEPYFLTFFFGTLNRMNTCQIEPVRTGNYGLGPLSLSTS